eukprot:156443-Pelagomonas_calceolata.AAC.1
MHVHTEEIIIPAPWVQRLRDLGSKCGWKKSIASLSPIRRLLVGPLSMRRSAPASLGWRQRKWGRADPRIRKKEWKFAGRTQ